MEKPEKPERLWTATFLVILAATFCLFMMAQGVNSSTSVFVELKGGTAAYSGTLALVFSLSAAAFRLVAGPLVDKKGRRVVMVFGFAVFLAGLFGPVVNQSPAAFVVWRVLQGIGFSASTTSVCTAASDVLPMSRLGEGIGYHGLGQALAMSVGPAFGLWLVGTDPAENVFFGLSVVGIVGLLLALLCTYEKHIERLPRTSAYYLRKSSDIQNGQNAQGEQDDSAPAGEAAKRRETPAAEKEPFWRSIIEVKAFAGVIPTFFLTPTFGFSIYFCGLYGTMLGVGNAGLYFTTSAITMILVRLAGKSFMDRKGPLFVLIAAAACGVLCLGLLIAACQVPVLFYVAGLFYGVCMGLGMPVGQSVAVKNSPAHRWGAANAVYQLAGDVGIGMSAVLFGVLNDAFGFTVSLVSALVLCACAIAVAYFAYPGHGLQPLEAREL